MNGERGDDYMVEIKIKERKKDDKYMVEVVDYYDKPYNMQLHMIEYLKIEPYGGGFRACIKRHFGTSYSWTIQDIKEVRIYLDFMDLQVYDLTIKHDGEDIYIKCKVKK